MMRSCIYKSFFILNQTSQKDNEFHSPYWLTQGCWYMSFPATQCIGIYNRLLPYISSPVSFLLLQFSHLDRKQTTAWEKLLRSKQLWKNPKNKPTKWKFIFILPQNIVMKKMPPQHPSMLLWEIFTSFTSFQQLFTTFLKLD